MSVPDMFLHNMWDFLEALNRNNVSVNSEIKMKKMYYGFTERKRNINNHSNTVTAKNYH